VDAAVVTPTLGGAPFARSLVPHPTSAHTLAIPNGDSYKRATPAEGWDPTHQTGRSCLGRLIRDKPVVGESNVPPIGGST